ncbi:uncharacterized protein LOC111047194 [Nilaparvata lugens]|uniref:uncharacterized protein LOC111047194 n=1 Tax=Nilaparvata lugens TaxID=108931 RepID=UPI00193CDE29|nr:uncharacterized protein LOC111047194 [Nilaparvata lugens]
MIDNSKMCASRVEMAKPKRARTTMGNWKYIVNTGDYSQSLRLEMCLRPQASCSYIAPGVRSECMQVYNYHRLLTWDQSTGLAMDMFKVPTCCSCHIQNGFMAGQSPRPPMPSGLPTMFPDSGPESNFITSELMSQAMQRLPPGMLQGMRMRGDMLGHHNIPKRESNSGGAGTPRRPPQGTVIHREPPLPLQDEAPPEAPPRYPPYHNNVRRTSLRNHSSDQDRQKIRGSIPLTPNQRHPDLPADNMISSVTSQQHLSPVTSHQLAAVTSQQQHPSQMTSHLSSVTSQQHPLHFSSVTSQHHPSQMTSRLPVTSPRSPVTSLTPVTSPVTTLVTVAPSRRINYSYHPIIDFFKTATSAVSNEEERSMDRADWRPVTEALLLHSKRQKLKE